MPALRVVSMGDERRTQNGYTRRARATPRDCAANTTSVRDIRVYTYRMKIVKVRRVGNSNVVSIPREFEASGYTPGSSVLVEQLPSGELRILPTEKLREQIKQIGRRVVTDHQEARKILAEHDPDATTPQ